MHAATSALAHSQMEAGASAAADDLLPSPVVRVAVGGISEMTLWRWTRELNFPQPDKIILRRKFWYRRTIAAWVEAQGGRETAGAA